VNNTPVENFLHVSPETCNTKPLNGLQNNKAKNSTTDGFMELLQLLFAGDDSAGAGMTESMQGEQTVKCDLKDKKTMSPNPDINQLMLQLPPLSSANNLLQADLPKHFVDSQSVRSEANTWPSNIEKLINQLFGQVTSKNPRDYFTEAAVVPQDELFTRLLQMAAGQQAGMNENRLYTGELQQSLKSQATLAQLNLRNLNYNQLSRLLSVLQNVEKTSGDIPQRQKLLQDAGLTNRALSGPVNNSIKLTDDQNSVHIREMPVSNTQAPGQATGKSVNGEQLKSIFTDKNAVLTVNIGNQEKNMFSEVKSDAENGRLTHGDKSIEAVTGRALNAYGNRPANNVSESVPIRETAVNHQQPHTSGGLFNTDGLVTIAKAAGAETPATMRPENNPVFMQLAEAIKGKVSKDSQGQTHVRLQLHPQNLGEVTIKLIYRDGNVTAHFQAASEQVKQIIENSLPQLRETLASFQLSLQNASVSVGHENGRWGQDGNQGRYFKKQHSAHIPSAGLIGQSGATVATQQEASSRLNYFV
jgi:flagellar hook-length control protein FliK